ncbi:unnamed protein product [Sphagnum balticum]
MALVWASNGYSLLSSESSTMRDFMSELNPRFTAPKRKKLQRLQANIMLELKTKICDILNHSTKIIRRVRVSTLLLERFRQLECEAGRVNERPLLSPKTRWMYNYVMLERMCEAQTTIETISTENRWNGLSGTEWLEAKALMEFLKHFQLFVMAHEVGDRSLQTPCHFRQPTNHRRLP